MTLKMEEYPISMHKGRKMMTPKHLVLEVEVEAVVEAGQVVQD